MKRCPVPLPLSVNPPGWAERFLHSRAGMFLLGFCTAAILAAYLTR
jgi:hypothetical protein